MSKHKQNHHLTNALDIMFETKQGPVLNIYCTAGYPRIDSLPTVIRALQDNGADIIEIGMPYSDPVADGPVIQQSNMQALENGMTIELLFQQLDSMKEEIHVPLVLMGYLNPVLQYGIDEFCARAAACGVSGLILPDLPMHEYKTEYRSIFEAYGLHAIFLVSPQTSEARMAAADKLSGGFLYAVSSSATTGSTTEDAGKLGYFERLRSFEFRNPVLIGFGISNHALFAEAAEYARGGIIGSAYIRALSEGQDISTTTREFMAGIRG